MNGSIVPGNFNTWQFNSKWTTWWIQNNSNDFAYISNLSDINLDPVDKNIIYHKYLTEPLCFYPVIEFRE